MIVTQTHQEALAKDYGRDLSITMARSQWRGDADTCLLVNGRRHQEATQALIQRLASLGAKHFKTQLHEPKSGTLPRYSYTTLTVTR